MRANRGRRGVSLLEVLIAVSILAIVLAMVYASLFRTSAEYEVNSRRAWILDQARQTLDEMAEDIRQGNRLSLQPIPAPPPPGTESSPPANRVSFFKILAPAAGVPQYTANPITYQWELSTNDPLVGGVWVDANNNRIVDEGRIVRIDENGRRRLMCNYVKNDPEGFRITQAFTTVGGVRQVQVRIRLTLIFTDSKNKTMEQTLETKLFMRNSL